MTAWPALPPSSSGADVDRYVPGQAPHELVRRPLVGTVNRQLLTLLVTVDCDESRRACDLGQDEHALVCVGDCWCVVPDEFPMSHSARSGGPSWALPTLTGSDSLGGEFEATFTPLDARRLAAALTLAADLADQG